MGDIAILLGVIACFLVVIMADVHAIRRRMDRRDGREGLK